MGKRRYKKNKKKRKQQDTTALQKKRTAFRGFDGKKYDNEGKEQDELYSDSEEENNEKGDNEATQYTYVKSYLRKVKNSNKTNRGKEYLQNFKNKNWKFNKNNQVHIMKYILFEQVFPKEYFDIFKEYMVGMFEATKKRFISQCSDNIKLYNEESENAQKMTFNIDGKELKFEDLEYKTEFLKAFHDRCVELIEE